MLDFFKISVTIRPEDRMAEYTNDYLLNRQVKIFQPVDGYRASTDAVILSSLIQKVKKNDKILDVGSGTGAISLCLDRKSVV